MRRDGAICSSEHENRHRLSNVVLAGAICSLEPVRGEGEREVARLAQLQHDCVHRQQLIAAQIGRHAIANRLRTQRLTSLHRDVYLVGRGQSGLMTRAMALVLHFSGDGVVSHVVAGYIWQMIESEPQDIDLTLVGCSAHPLPGVRIHRVTTLEPRDVRWRRDLPVTSPARTVVDLAGVVDVFELENVLAVCWAEKLAAVKEIREAMERAPRSPGIGTLRRLLDQGGFARTRSYYERKVLKMLAQAGLPRPLTNHKVVGHEVDMVWHDKRLALEFDSRKFHGDRRAFERDRRRDQDLVAAGFRVIRVTARQLEKEPLRVIARLAAALA